MGSLKTFTLQWKSEQKISFDEFVALIDILTESGNNHLIKANEEELLELPLWQWMERLTTLQNADNICDVESIQFRLNQLQELYGALLRSLATDLHHIDSRFKRTLHKVLNGPNALQFANAQYAALSLRDRSKQMWCISSGQGKSRVLATIALILLLAGSTTKVHLVFDSIHLMQRDQREFSHWFELNGILSQVEFHVGLDFECQPGEIILVDEADQLVLSNPAMFFIKIQHNKCICLTATPDNEDKLGVEREVLKLMGFSMFNGQPEAVVGASTTNTVSTVSELKMNEILQLSPHIELVSYIKEELKDNAVLLYCYQEF